MPARRRHGGIRSYVSEISVFQPADVQNSDADVAHAIEAAADARAAA